MEDAVRALGIACTDEEVNQLAQRHFESTQVHVFVLAFFKVGSFLESL